MSLVRFATAEALFETFPELSQKISAKPSQQFPTKFLQTLVTAGQVEGAVTFWAYLLPRREGVWGACRCARASSGHFAGDRAVALVAAEAWVKEPDDERRQAALELGTRGHCDDALTWVALAAGWAGGFFVSRPPLSISLPQFLTARGPRTGMRVRSLRRDR